MKKITFFLFLLLASAYLNAQTWEWAKNYSYGSQNSGTYVQTDNAGNMYVGNGFSSTFLKCDPTGKVVCSFTTDVGGSVVTDGNGNNYFTNGNRIAKYTSTGTKIWEVTSSIPNPNLQNIGLHPSGDIVIVGWTVANNPQSIFCRYDMNGNLVWEKLAEFSPGGMIIKCDKSGNIYITGNCSKDSASGNLGFLVKYTNSGQMIYNKPVPATASGIAFDNNNNVYMNGWFSLQPINISGHIYTTNGSEVHQFLIKYDGNANVLWYKIITGNLGSGWIATDNNGNMYLTNSYTTLNIDTISLTAENNHAADAFIMKADSQGNILWLRESIVQGKSAGASTGAICVTGNGDIIIAGSMNGTNTFGPFTLTQLSTYWDLLLLKINQSGTTSISTKNNSSLGIENEELVVFPNPTSGSVSIKLVHYDIKKENIFLLCIKNERGQIIYSETVKNASTEFNRMVDLSAFPKGVYFVEVNFANQRKTKRIILE